jgi:hypothetical protein
VASRGGVLSIQSATANAGWAETERRVDGDRVEVRWEAADDDSRARVDIENGALTGSCDD